ncbi:peptidyl-prolyl cis-trans isomerase FKBP18, chloroplastic isoform X2 [Elaeis guineensis]|uniref:peptidyl-prolyl cis-trans isomerase FKBP18, chloroplastic isoform X2 n=1 Tax=Elaeis guineensis var. tenera TaxID=51953 RepID=UPI003C6CE41B
MASIRSFPKALIDDTLLSSPPIEITTTAAAARKKLLQQPSPNLLPLPISRRDALLISVLPFNLTALCLPSQARERRGRKAISPEEFMTSPDGLKYYDIIEGKGPKAEKGSTVQVHFDCIYRGITAVSSRESKLLAGNRIIAQLNFKAGTDKAPLCFSSLMNSQLGHHQAKKGSVNLWTMQMAFIQPRLHQNPHQQCIQ